MFVKQIKMSGRLAIKDYVGVEAVYDLCGTKTI